MLMLILKVNTQCNTSNKCVSKYIFSVLKYIMYFCTRCISSVDFQFYFNYRVHID